MSEAHAMLLSLMVEKNDDGYLASIPGMQGAFAEGDTMEEAVFNCVDVAKLIAAYRQERGEDLGYNRIEFTSATRLMVSMPIEVA